MTFDYDDIRNDLAVYAGVELTDEQIDTILDKMDEEDRVSIAEGFDTCERDYFMCMLAEHVLDGWGKHWPINGEIGTPYSNEFPERYAAGCEKHGIKLCVPLPKYRR